jgi:photosynthetic reaction center H subunit
MVDIVGTIDVAQAVLYAFWVFFALLIWNLRAEDRREGHPLEEDLTGEYPRDSWLFLPQPKEFVLPHGEGTRRVPQADERETRPLNLQRTSGFEGTPYMPAGNPLRDGVGPAAWAARSDQPDRTPHGTPKIVPLRLAPSFAIPSSDQDPRGLRVIAADGRIAGEVTEVWVDQSESLIRYLEMTMGDETRLIPALFAKLRRPFRGGRREYYVHALTAEQFRDVPMLASRDQVTKLEEDKLVGYFGGGALYATPARAEPFL